MDFEKELPKEELQEIPLSLKKKLIGTYDDFLFGQGMETKIIEKNNRLYVESPFYELYKGKNDNELLYLKNGLFKILDYPNLLQFNFNNEKLNSVILFRDNLSTKIEISDKIK